MTDGRGSTWATDVSIFFIPFILTNNIYGQCTSFHGSSRNCVISEKMPSKSYTLKLNNDILTERASFKLQIVQYLTSDLMSSFASS